jgi:tRNA(fMet)-specific endonuclease VapC
MSVYVLDANIVSYYLKEHPQVIQNIETAIMAGYEIQIAPIAYYEVRRGLLLVNSQKRMEKFERLCELLPVGAFDNRALDIAAGIYVEQRQKGRPADDADIFIAAFCKVNGFTLVTHNTKHFEHLDGLTLIDWTVST